MKIIFHGTLLWCFLALSACTEPSTQKQTVTGLSLEVSLIYAANVQGELEPCGCTPDTDFGGILRHSTGLMTLRQQFPQAFAVAAGGLLDTVASTQKIKNQFILQGFQKLGYDAIGLQWRDLAFGESLLMEKPLPWVASNYPRSSFVKSRVITRSGKQLKVFSLLDSAGFSLMTGREKFQQLTDELLPLIKQSRAQNEIILVLLSPNMQDWLLSLQDQVDFIVLPTGAEQFEPPRALTPKTWLLQPGHRGMYLGAANFLRSSQGEWQLRDHQILPLSAQVANDAKLQPWYEQYNAELRTAYQQEVAIKKQILTESNYVGAAACQSCHQAAYAVWQNSAHAHAFDKLKAVNKAFDPECVNCHVVGLHQTGGFIDEVTTPHLANVQCESCHGSRRDHVRQPVINSTTAFSAQRATEAICENCHNAQHSPKFDFKKYWPLIKHQ